MLGHQQDGKAEKATWGRRMGQHQESSMEGRPGAFKTEKRNKSLGFRPSTPSSRSDEARVSLFLFSLVALPSSEKTPCSPVLIQACFCRLQPRSLNQNKSFTKVKNGKHHSRKVDRRHEQAIYKRIQPANKHMKPCLSSLQEMWQIWKLVITGKTSFICGGNTIDYAFLKGNEQPPTSSNSS